MCGYLKAESRSKSSLCIIEKVLEYNTPPEQIGYRTSKREVPTLDGDLLRYDWPEEKKMIIASQHFTALLSETRVHY